MRRWLVRGLLVSGLVLGGGRAGPVAADDYPFCAPGQTPEVAAPFKPMWDNGGFVVGAVRECAHTDTSGDLVQQTYTGTLRQRQGSGTVTFNSDTRHWAVGLGGVIVHWIGDQLEPPAALLAGPPSGVSALVPAGATVRLYATADLTGTGSAQWVVYYTVPRQGAGAAFGDGDPYVLIAVQGADGAWRAGTTFGEEYMVVGTVSLVPLPGVPGVVLEGGVGAHGSQIKMVRWDGQSFAVVLDDGSNSPGLNLTDLDGDGVPELVNYYSPYCQSYAASPRMVTILGWNGTSYVDQTGRFPDIVAKVTDDIRAALNSRAANWQGEDKACLYWALGVLTEKVGNVADAGALYQQALQTDPGYDLDGGNSAVPLAQDQASPVGRVKLFYQRLSLKDYARAYSLLSQAAQQAKSYPDWAAGYDTTERIDLEFARPGGAPNTVQISVVAVDRSAAGPVTRRFVGEWTLVQADARWRLDTAQIQVAP